MKLWHTIIPKLILFFLASLFLSSCGSDENGPSDQRISGVLTKVSSLDLGDNNNPNDIRISFELNADHRLSELRVFVVKSLDQPMVTLSKASQLSSDSYDVVSIEELFSSFRLSENLLDFNGAAITNDNQYSLNFYLVQESNEGLADITGSVLLSSEPYLNGGYSGTWNDNIYTNFAITADLTFSEGVLKGPFYYTNTFFSCCGGSNDGSIEIVIGNDGNVRFSYDQMLVQFMGGGCDGDYSGKGIQDTDTSFRIDFTGDDCEGAHTNGRIVLTKL